MKKFFVVLTIVAFFGAISAPAFATVSNNLVYEKVEGEPVKGDKKTEKSEKKAEKKADCKTSCDGKKEKKACGDKDKK